MSKLGSFLSILKHVAPIVLSAIPQTAPIADEVAAAIAESEQLPAVLKRDVPGFEKKTHLLNLGAQIITAHNELHPSHPLELGTALEAVGGATEAILATIKLAQTHTHTEAPADVKETRQAAAGALSPAGVSIIHTGPAEPHD